ncbi:hypothetical protein DH2020_022263 [Rehmannia glutinosa]|uniref:Glucan endo-1,3-beta-D-glucosidase n=1 Tax=Rehmannia glutinosa TaxID=99300 RepID=A0ABR0WF15_REHGL
MGLSSICIHSSRFRNREKYCLGCGNGEQSRPAIMERIYALIFVSTCLLYVYPGARAIGINYGLLGDNLPPPANVISLLKQRNVPKIRIFEPNQDVLTALHNSGVSVIIGTRNEDLQPLASNPSAAANWVQTNVIPHYTSVNIKCIAAGNEVYPDNLAQYIPGAMQNLDSALSASKISIPVSTAVSMVVLSNSNPPSQGAFQPVMTQITNLLASKNSPLLVNVYPYYAGGELSYALFKDNATAFRDNQLTYRNMFDAMVDAVYAALEKVGGSQIEIVVTETGWPSDGGRDASIENAQTYVNNLIKHVSSGQGTPRKPGKDIDTYIFAMFNEDLKHEGIERHWGLYYPNLTEVYHANL